MADFDAELEELLKGIRDGSLDVEAAVANVDDATVSALRKKLNPLGTAPVADVAKVPDPPRSIMSLINLKEEYMKRILLTGLIGFLYRRLDEWGLDDGEPVTHLDDFDDYLKVRDAANAAADEARSWIAANPEPTRPAPVDSKADDADAAATAETKEDGVIYSVASGVAPTPQEVGIQQAHAKWRAEFIVHNRAIKRALGYNQRIVARQFIDELFQFNPDKHVRSAHIANPLDPERLPLPRVVPKKQKLPDEDPREPGSASQQPEPQQPAPGVEVVLEGQPATAPLNVFTAHIPPADTFLRYERFFSAHYEQIRDAVKHIYADKPDLEFVVMPYGDFAGKEAADKFVHKHSNEVIADLQVLTKGTWNLMGPFRQNRERINFYNNKTGVLEGMMQQIESDKKLGADLMRKRVAAKKAENVSEMGPDDAEFTQSYRKNQANNQAEQMGAEDVARTGVKSAEPNQFKQHEECPYDAVQVDVFNVAQGGVKVTKSSFYTKAEAPEMPPIVEERKA